MPKLSKQQIIILCIMVAAIAVAGYDLFYSKKNPKVGNKNAARQQALQTFITGLNADMSKFTDLSVQAHIISRAETGWHEDPFMKQGESREWKKIKSAEKSIPQNVTFVYTGFAESGKRTMAVINGNEYAVGDTLDIGGYTVKKISPAMIIIEKIADGSSVQVPMSE